MTKKVFALDTKPGIQRDGTIFDKEYYTSGQWVRFQRSRPRKIGGYKEITCSLSGISRGIYVDAANGFNRIFNGYNDGLQTLTINNNGVGAGIIDFTISSPINTLGILVGGSSYTNGTYTDVPLTGGSGSGAKATIVVALNTVSSVTVTNDGNGYVVGDVLSADATSIGGTGSGFSIKVASVDTAFTPSDMNLWQFDSLYNVAGGENTLLAHPGKNLTEIDSTINSPVLYGSISGSTVSPLKDTEGPSPTNDIIEVSGGVVALHPYVVVYGNAGLIKNCSAGNPSDWNSADANEVNVASGKIIKGLPVRGGTNSPSGLFWSLDSIIRMSYSPTTITTGATQTTQYWRYDIISSQSSILSSQCVIEYDGIYYWAGTDRFLLYNGVVKEIPNQMNQNWFFDNLNYNQRQKVWATKVPRYGEIWWFYPRGDATECTDAVIYNVRENVWYDTGEAIGARRSAGYFSQVFRFPINASADLDQLGGINELTLTNAGSGYTNGTYTFESLTGGTGSGATATIVVSGGVVTSVTLAGKGINYTEGDVLSASIPSGSNLEITVSQITNFVCLWQHEYGTDEVKNTSVNAIMSYFETNDLGWVSGGPSQPSPVGENKWVHLERLEPDFIQQGEMELYVTGRPYAQAEDKTTGPYTFGPETQKIDLREQRRELRLKFVSNVAGGDYQTGKNIVSADMGDVRGY